MFRFVIQIRLGVCGVVLRYSAGCEGSGEGGRSVSVVKATAAKGGFVGDDCICTQVERFGRSSERRAVGRDVRRSVGWDDLTLDALGFTVSYRRSVLLLISPSTE